MNRDQILSVILTLAFFGVLISWSPVNAEEVTGQEQDVSLYLYSQNGVGKLHTKETGGHGDAEEVTIQPGSSVFFALNYSLQADLPVKSYRSNIGFHIYLYASSTDWNAGHLKIFVRDGTTMTNGEIIASGEINIPAAFADEVHVDIPWEEGYGPEYNFDMEHFIVLELENDGTNGVNLDMDSGKSGDSPSRLITTTNPVRDIEVTSESYNLETSDSEDKIVTNNFNPNLPSNISKMFVSGEALNAFGTYDITRFQVSVFDSDDNELFVGEVEVDEPEQNSGANIFEDIVWNYNDPSEPSENHNGKGLYTVKVAAIDQQGNEFSLEKQVQMDAYGVYLSTPEPQQSVAVGDEVEYQIFVLNSGDEMDRFTVEPSETSDNWVVSPETWTSNSLGPGDEQVITFTISAANSTDMVGKNTVVVFTAQSENSVTPVNFDLETKTSVGAEYELSLYFDDPESGQAVSSLSTTGVAGEWNPYSLSIANQGQDTDSAQLIAQGVPPDWEVKFEYGDLNDGSIVVEGIPRLGDNYNVINVTVWAKPAQGGDIETANIQLIGISQGDTAKSDTAILSLTRTFGLIFSAINSDQSGLFVNKKADETFNIDMRLESAVEDDYTILLDVDDLPSGWSHSFKDENGATVTDVSLSGGESKVLDLIITVGSQATYDELGYSFNAIATAMEDSSLVGRQPITVFLKLTDTPFELSALKYKEVLGPGDSYTFQLNIENKANGDDRFTLSAPSVPSGWRIVFPNGMVFDVLASRSVTVPIQVTASDESKDGDKKTIQISISSDLSNQAQQQSFVVEVEQGFTAKLVTSFSDLWYIFAFLGLIVVIGFATYSRQEDSDWDYDDDYADEEGSSPPQDKQSDDDWDDWN